MRNTFGEIWLVLGPILILTLMIGSIIMIVRFYFLMVKLLNLKIKELKDKQNDSE